MLKPIRDNVVLELIEQEAVSAGGIVLPGSSLEKPYRGVVVARNKQFVMPDGTIKQCELDIGDVAVFGKTHGTDIKYGETTYRVISEDLILCKEWWWKRPQQKSQALKM